MDWDALQTGLKDLVARVSGVALFNVAWDGEPDVMRGFPMAMLEFNQTRSDPASSDETRYEEQEDGTLVPVVLGHRLVELQVTIKSRDQRGSKKAGALLDKFRTRLQLPRAQEKLEELGVVLRASTFVKDLSAVVQQREESIAQISLTLSYVSIERETDEDAEEPIEHVELSGEIAVAADSGEEVITIPATTIS